MKLYSTFIHSDGLLFIICEDASVGFYLYVYEDRESFDLDLKDEGACRYHQQDHLQDSLEQAQNYAQRKFGVPLDTWMSTVAA